MIYVLTGIESDQAEAVKQAIQDEWTEAQEQGRPAVLILAEGVKLGEIPGRIQSMSVVRLHTGPVELRIDIPTQAMTEHRPVPGQCGV